MSGAAGGAAGGPLTQFDNLMEAKRESTDFYEGHLPTMTANDKISYLTEKPLGHVGKVDTSQQVIMCSSINHKGLVMAVLMMMIFGKNIKIIIYE